MTLIDDLLQSFCKRNRRSSEIASACSDYLSENNGEDLALLLDGYDEYPERLREDSLIADILKSKELPCCGLVVSSRPHASMVSINNSLSDTLPVVSGVPQGSILGPILFLIYMNSITESVQHSHLLQFTDDTKCFKSVSSISDQALLQDDLNTLCH